MIQIILYPQMRWIPMICLKNSLFVEIGDWQIQPDTIKLIEIWYSDFFTSFIGSILFYYVQKHFIFDLLISIILGLYDILVFELVAFTYLFITWNISIRLTTFLMHTVVSSAYQIVLMSPSGVSIDRNFLLFCIVIKVFEILHKCI